MNDLLYHIIFIDYYKGDFIIMIMYLYITYIVVFPVH